MTREPAAIDLVAPVAVELQMDAGEAGYRAGRANKVAFILGETFDDTVQRRPGSDSRASVLQHLWPGGDLVRDVEGFG